MTTLASAYEGIVCDLDGVVYKGSDAVPHAIEALSGARQAGLRIVYATNNASRPPREVADQLGSLGLTLVPADVVCDPAAFGYAQRWPLLMSDALPDVTGASAHCSRAGQNGRRGFMNAAGQQPL